MLMLTWMAASQFARTLAKQARNHMGTWGTTQLSGIPRPTAAPVLSLFELTLLDSGCDGYVECLQGSLLAVSSRGRRNKEFAGPLLSGHQSPHGAPPSWAHHFPKAPPTYTTRLGLRFLTWTWGDTFRRLAAQACENHPYLTLYLHASRLCTAAIRAHGLPWTILSAACRCSGKALSPLASFSALFSLDVLPVYRTASENRRGSRLGVCVCGWQSAKLLQNLKSTGLGWLAFIVLLSYISALLTNSYYSCDF